MNPSPAQPPSRLAALSQFTARQPGPLVAAIGFLLIGVMGLVDYWLTSHNVALPIYYVIPIVGLAWFLGWQACLIAAVLSALINFLIVLAFAASFQNPILIHIVSIVIFAAAFFVGRWLSTIRMLLEYYYRGDVWKATYRPTPVGDRLTIVPAWLAESYHSRPAEILLILDPGRSFGTGSHPTTQMCLALLDSYLKPSDRVFDLGCGTGILSVAAAKLGAGSVLAVDIDPGAERATKENAALNGVSDKIEFRLGSLDAIRNSQLAIPSSQFNITVANILAHIIADLLKEGLAQTLAADGALILSGIRAEQAADITAAVRAAGLQIVEQRESLEWVALVARPN